MNHDHIILTFTGLLNVTLASPLEFYSVTESEWLFYSWNQKKHLQVTCSSKDIQTRVISMQKTYFYQSNWILRKLTALTWCVDLRRSSTEKTFVFGKFSALNTSKLSKYLINEYINKCEIWVIWLKSFLFSSLSIMINMMN